MRKSKLTNITSLKIMPTQVSVVLLSHSVNPSLRFPGVIINHIISICRENETARLRQRRVPALVSGSNTPPEKRKISKCWNCMEISISGSRHASKEEADVVTSLQGNYKSYFSQSDRMTKGVISNEVSSSSFDSNDMRLHLHFLQ